MNALGKQRRRVTPSSEPLTRTDLFRMTRFDRPTVVSNPCATVLFDGRYPILGGEAMSRETRSASVARAPGPLREDALSVRHGSLA